MLTFGACCVEMSTVSRRVGRPSSYSTDTCVLPSGRRKSTIFSLRTLREAARHAVREPDRHRHEVFGVVARVAEHHALVAGADLVVRVAGADLLLVRLVDAHRDVGRLLVDRHDHAARLAVDAVRGVGVADAADRVAGEAREVDVRLGADLTGDDAETGRDEGLARRRARTGPRSGPRRGRCR